MKKFKAGTYIQNTDYKSFLPSSVNRNYEISNPKILVLLEKARGLIGELNAYSRSVPDIDFYIFMLVAKDATVSSRIEGTRTNLDEAIKPEKEIAPERKDDWKEVNNHINATNFATKELKNLPLCMRLIRETHKVLLSGARGENRQPGELRKIQNWIGAPGSTLASASFVPPPPEEVLGLLSDLEKFWHNPELDVPELIKIAVTHYQFETIHPFSDGNGRMGRLMIVLQLISSGMLNKPCLYLSDYFENNKKLYYDSLNVTRENDDIEQWIRFFLEGVCQTTEKTINTFERIETLAKSCEEKINTNMGKKVTTAHKLLKHLYSMIEIDVKQVEELLCISKASANSLVADFVELGILKQKNDKSRNRKFVFADYFNLFID